jgi:hypothetical protein
VAGRKHGLAHRRKMKDAQVVEARRLRMAEGIGWERLGRRYGVSASAMRNACLGITYAWIEDLRAEVKAFEAQRVGE